jgi:hypothetical protein
MARKKSNKILGVLGIFFTGIKTYFLYLDQCAKYLAFPVFGQLLSVAVMFTLTYYFNTNVDNIKNLAPFLNNDTIPYAIFWIVLLPFLIIFVKALYEYIIAFSALNILFFTVSHKKKVKDIDFKANNKVIERKLIHYILLMLLVTILLIVPPLIFVAPLIWVFLCLCFQVFAFENDINAFKAVSRSIELVKGNVIATIILLLLVTALTYWFLPVLFLWAFNKISFTYFLIGRLEAFLQLISFENINNVLALANISLTPLSVAKDMAEGIIISVIIAFTLPYRCCCFTELYRLYDYEKIKEFSKESDEIISRATGKQRKN